MQDYWNDPPDYPEPPECCDDVMEVFDDGVCLCSHCGLRIDTCVPDWDIGPEPTGELLQRLGHCAACGYRCDWAWRCCRWSPKANRWTV